MDSQNSTRDSEMKGEQIKIWRCAQITMLKSNVIPYKHMKLDRVALKDRDTQLPW